jgi:hypothetical protein
VFHKADSLPAGCCKGYRIVPMKLAIHIKMRDLSKEEQLKNGPLIVHVLWEAEEERWPQGQ